MSRITTHVLDANKGKPAQLVPAVLFKRVALEWFKVAKGFTNNKGKIPNLIANDDALPFGTYKRRFETKSYFDTQKIKSFYPRIEIIFEINSPDHYHIPLLLSSFGYSTYSGS